MQESINALMVDYVVKKMSLQKWYFCFFCCIFLIIVGCSKKNLGSRNLYVSRKQRMKISGVSLKRRGIFVGNHVEFLT